jgi:hypothetical protein
MKSQGPPEALPFLEQGPLAQKLLELGWEWSANDADWVAHFRRDFSDEAVAAHAEDEIRGVMGGYYVSSDEIQQRAEEWREKLSRL